MSMLEHALAAAEQGYHVFPLLPGTKIPPRGDDWRKVATNDADIINGYWAIEPGANIGLVPGLSGHMVLDVDTKGGKPGYDSLSKLDPELALAIAMGDVPGRVVETPSGGWHIYYTTDTEMPNTAGTLGPGLDTRSKNGYVLAPGSVIDGRTYSLIADGAPPPAPDHLRRATSKAEVREAPEGVELDQPAAIAWAMRHIAALPVFVEGEESDFKTYQLMCRLRDRGVSEDAALGMLVPWADRCGFDPEWVAAKAKNAYSYGQNEVGCDSPAAVFRELIQAHATEELTPDPPRHNRFAAAALTGDAIDKLTPPKWIYSKLMEQASLNLMVGAYGTKKTFLALDLALRAATGMPWAGHTCAGPQRVVYCAGEGAFGIRGRVKAWASRYSERQTPDNFTLMPTIPIASTPDDWEAFLEYVAERKPTLVFLDTVARAMIGLDEMSTRDMMTFVMRCGQIQALGAAVFLVHHEGKDGSKGSRGAVALPAAVELELSVAVKGDEITVTAKKLKNAPEWAGPQVFTADREVFDAADEENGSSLVVMPIAAHVPETVSAPASDGPRLPLIKGDTELAQDVQAVLKDAALKSPNGRVRSDGELADMVMDMRADIGIEELTRHSPDFAKKVEALRGIFRRRRSSMSAQLAPYYREEAGGWGYWGLLT